MTRYVTRSVVPLIVVLATAVLATAVPAATAGSNARLTVVARTPLTVSGLGFPPGRAVMLQVVTPNGSQRRALRSSAAAGSVRRSRR